MTSPPDVQNVPDIFGLLEWAHKALTGDYLSDETIAFMPVLEAALAQRDRFVLVPKEPVAHADHGILNWIADRQFRHETLLYAAAPTSKGKP